MIIVLATFLFEIFYNKNKRYEIIYFRIVDKGFKCYILTFRFELKTNRQSIRFQNCMGETRKILEENYFGLGAGTEKDPGRCQ